MKKLYPLFALIITMGFTTCAKPNDSTPEGDAIATITFNNTDGIGGQAETVTATYGQPMPVITAVPSKTGHYFTGYWDAQTDGKKYYNADKTSAANWDKEEDSCTLYAQWSPLSEEAISSVVSLVQSTTVAQAKDFTYAEILALTREAIELAGGLEGIVKAGDVVVLKPNVICTVWNWGTSNGTNHIPQLMNGVCTDRRVIQAVAEIVREIVGPSGKILVIEGSGNGFTTTHFNALGYTLANFVNVDEIIALETEGTWVGAGNASGSTGYVTQVTLENFDYTSAGPGNWNGAVFADYFPNGKYYVNKKMYEADALISIPVVKSHWNATVTGGIKNISIGAAPSSVYGISATNVGRNGMVNHSSVNLHKWIADFFACLPADFVVMDGLQGLQNGPLPSVNSESALAAHQKNLRSMLASRDPLAIDMVEANIIGWDYTSIPYFTHLAARGEVGGKPNGRVIPLRGDPKDIVVLGNKKVDDVRGDYASTNQDVNNPGVKISTANKTKPTITITSAEFSGAALNLALEFSTGANNNVVKIDVYIDGAYQKSFNANMTNVSFDASNFAAGSHDIEVRAYTQFMYSTTATVAVTK